MPVAVYREYRPVAELRPFIRCFWHLDRTHAPDEPPEMVWPQLSVEVIFHFGDRYVGPMLSDGPVPHAFAIGPLSRFVSLRSPGRVRLVGARCFPWAIARLFGVRLRELRDAVLPFGDLAPEAAWRLEEQLAESSPEQAVTTLSRYFVGRLEATDHRGMPATAGLRAHLLGASASVHDLAARAGLSVRQLERRFDAEIGVSPKRLLRIARFNVARQKLLADPSRDLLDLVYEGGYVDYAHMTRDFREFFGVTPAAFRQRIFEPVAGPDVVFVQDDGLG